MIALPITLFGVFYCAVFPQSFSTHWIRLLVQLPQEPLISQTVDPLSRVGDVTTMLALSCVALALMMNTRQITVSLAVAANTLMCIGRLTSRASGDLGLIDRSDRQICAPRFGVTVCVWPGLEWVADRLHEPLSHIQAVSQATGVAVPDLYTMRGNGRFGPRVLSGESPTPTEPAVWLTQEKLSTAMIPSLLTPQGDPQCSDQLNGRDAANPFLAWQTAHSRWWTEKLGVKDDGLALDPPAQDILARVHSLSPSDQGAVMSSARRALNACSIPTPIVNGKPFTVAPHAPGTR